MGDKSYKREGEKCGNCKVDCGQWGNNFFSLLSRYENYNQRENEDEIDIN